MEEPTYDEFVGYLRSSLHYLYDTVHLRRSPLVGLLGLTHEFDQGTALQRTLTNAINALKPTDDEPPQSPAWRIHDTLSLQYIRQFPRDVVASQLGISERQLRREQRLALEVLAQHLWREIDLTERPELEQPGPPATEKDQVLSNELSLLQSPAQEQRSPIGEICHTVQSLAQPLAEQWQVLLCVHIADELVHMPLAQLTMRNVLLTMLSVTIPQTSYGQVTLSVTRVEQGIEFSIACSRDGLAPAPDEEDPGMKTARQLASFYGAELSTHRQETGFTITLTLPAAEQIPVLIIDDNTGWDEMLKRYAVGSRYRVTGTHEPKMARSLAEKLQPAVIFLDVMMPEVDGWQVLSELRQEQSTSHIPIVVCTVLPMERLALSLGVNAFLQKPVTQDQFLDTLNKLTLAPGWSSSAGQA